jgi:hypothetical protein
MATANSVLTAGILEVPIPQSTWAPTGLPPEQMVSVPSMDTLAYLIGSW